MRGAGRAALPLLRCPIRRSIRRARAASHPAPARMITHSRAAAASHTRRREAYAWLRHNTHPEAKVASWWDYGYQTTAMVRVFSSHVCFALRFFL